MQRLNAIFSFIENRFQVNGKYFNVSQFPTAKEAAERGIFVQYSGPNVLSLFECAPILDYQLAVTIFSVSDQSDVTRIFGRINSGGKQLSPQEQRQAGVVSPFAAVVRKLGAEMRGDDTDEIVTLADMPQVSIDAPSFNLGYGVQADDTFWCKQGIMSVRELRDGLDEQIIADLAASILLDQPLAASRETLDDVYDTEKQPYVEMNN